MAKTSLFSYCLPIVAALWAVPAIAGPIVDKATEIETLIAADDLAGAATAASDLYALVWESAPAISFRTVVLVSESGGGFGVYNPRADAKYKAGEPVVIYAEPYGYGFGAPGEGLHAIGFNVDLKVLSETGDILGEIPDLAALDLQSRAENYEFQANLTYNLNGVTPGKYVLQTTFRDKNSAKTGTFDMTIEIVE